MLWLILLWLGVAQAEMPLPSYRTAATRAAWYDVNELVEARRYEEAIARAEAFEETVTETAGLEYLVGLSWRMLDDGKKAEAHLRRSVELDPEYAAPWGELGEIYMVQGRFDEARTCFEHVTELVQTGPGATSGPRRLAEIAAQQGDAPAFETHIREALRRGFSFREIAGLPNWQRYYADPRVRDSIEKMVTVYGDKRILETLAPQQAEGPSPKPSP